MRNPIVHTLQVLVEAHHLDEMKHVNNVVYFSFLQEAAISHWYGMAPARVAENIRWVVRKHEIEYLKPAFEGDTLSIKTWIDEFTAVSSRRFYEIWRDQDLIVKASTLWIALDARKMKPTRVPEEVADLFFESN